MARARMILDFLSRGRSHRYGPASSQSADLYLPSGSGPHPVMVLIHGGSWQKRYGKIVMRGLAGDLVRRGWAVWNLEYRRLGDGGAGRRPSKMSPRQSTISPRSTTPGSTSIG